MERNRLIDRKAQRCQVWLDEKSRRWPAQCLGRWAQGAKVSGFPFQVSDVSEEWTLRRHFWKPRFPSLLISYLLPPKVHLILPSTTGTFPVGQNAMSPPNDAVTPYGSGPPHASCGGTHMIFGGGTHGHDGTRIWNATRQSSFFHSALATGASGFCRCMQRAAGGPVRLSAASRLAFGG